MFRSALSMALWPSWVTAYDSPKSSIMCHAPAQFCPSKVICDNDIISNATCSFRPCPVVQPSLACPNADAQANDTFVCDFERFACKNRQCVPKKWKCDGEPDCEDKSDEAKCEFLPGATCTKRNSKYCSSGTTCVNKAGKGCTGNDCHCRKTCAIGGDEGPYKCGEDSNSHYNIERNKTACASTGCSQETCCSCDVGFHRIGGHGECVDIDECEGTPCHLDAACRNVVGTYTCTCKSGYRGNGTSCEYIDECAEQMHSCHSNALCTNVMGSYQCECRTGYVGNGISCTETCATGRRGAPYDCAQHSDSHYNFGNDATACPAIGCSHESCCTCDTGFRRGGGRVPCVDINECKEGRPCHKDATCSNTAGWYTCTCKDGYRGNGTFCEDIHECNEGTDDCHDMAECINTDGKYRCVCKSSKGYVGNGFSCKATCDSLDSCGSNSWFKYSARGKVCTTDPCPHHECCHCDIGYRERRGQCKPICASIECRENSTWDQSVRLDLCTDGYCTQQQCCECLKGYERQGSEDCKEINK